MSSLRTMTAVDALYVSAMVTVIVCGDVLCFRHHLWPRLSFNVGTVLVFLAFYTVHLQHPPPASAATKD